MLISSPVLPLLTAVIHRFHRVFHTGRIRMFLSEGHEILGFLDVQFGSEAYYAILTRRERL